MSANNNNNSTSSKASKTSSSPVPSIENPIFIQVPLRILKKVKGCKSRCACKRADLDTRKSKVTVRIVRIVGWFGVGSVAEKQNGNKNANKILKVNVTLESTEEDLKRKAYFDTHNHWFTFTNHAQDPNLAKYIGEFSLFAREKGFLDCLAFEDFKTGKWVVNPLDIERKKLENQPKKAEPRRKEIVEDLEDLDLFIDEPLKKTQAEDPKFVYNGESDSDSDLKDAESEEDEEAFDEKAFREEIEKTEPIDISSDDDSEEGKNCASTLEQFKKESATAFAFTQNQPVEEEEDAFDDKTVETTDPTELVEDSVIANDKSVDATLEKTLPVEHSISETHTELVNIFASIMNDEPTEETKKLEEDYSFLLDYDFRRACETTQKEVPQVVDVAEPIIQQVPVENKPEETTPVESTPMEIQPVESIPVEVQPEEEKPMEVESEKPTEPENDVQEARSETSAPVVETPVIEASATETLLVPAAPEQPKTPQKVLPVSGMELRKRKQPEKKDEKKATPHTSRRRAKNQ